MTSVASRFQLVRRLVLCLPPMLIGIGAAVLLLLVAGGPARQVYASTLTFPGCASTIQGCIDIAGSGDTILISAGNYTESLTLSKAVSLSGASASTTILHALPNARVLTVTGAAVDGSVVISGLTFTGGHVTGCGGGIFITANAHPRVHDVVIANNHASGGGGGLCSYVDSPLVLNHVSVISNSALSGGGVLAISAMVTDTNFSNNTADGYGGGIYVVSGVLVATNAVFVDNSARFGGGAFVNCHYCILTLHGGLFRGNSASGSGGGLEFSIESTAAIAVTGTQFIDNSARSGGGLLVAGTQAGYPADVIVNALFAGNTATGGDGAAIYYLGPANTNILFTTIASPTLGSGSAVLLHGTASVIDSIFSNYETGISLTYGSANEDYNLFDNVGVATTGGVSSGGHSFNGNPVFRDPAHDNYHLSPGSAAIDAGVDVGVPFDVDGAPRPYGPGFDIGYDEFTGVFNVYLPLVWR